MKRISKMVITAAAMGMVLTGCQSNSGGATDTTVSSDTQAAKEGSLTIGMVASAFGTQSYNDDVLAGLKLCESELGAKGIPLEVSDIADSANSMRTLIGQGANLIMVPSSEYKDGMLQVADESTETKFLYLVDPIEGKENIMSISYREQEAAFLGGALAGMLTKTNNVGVVLGVSETLQDRYQYGFRAGVQAVNPDAEVQVAYTNSYTDVGQGNEVAKMMYNKNADIIGTYAGACNLGVFNAAKDAGEGRYCLGAANGQFDKMPEKIIASVVKPADEAILSIVKTWQETGEFDTSKPSSLGLKQDGVKLLFTDNEELLRLVPEDVMAAIEDMTAKIESGELVVPEDETSFETFNWRYQ